MNKLKSVFFGTPAFAVPSLKAALEQTEVKVIITQPDRPRGRGHKVLPCEVKESALAAGVRVFSPSSLKKDSPELQELKALLDQLKPDIFLVTAYGNLLPQDFLDRPRLGCINVHASLLPRWRGAAPIQRAVEAGDTQTGVCLQKMVMALDAGDILAQSEQVLGPEVSSGDLFTELAETGGALLSRYLRELGSSELVGMAQDTAHITLAKKISKEEGLWSPDWGVTETHNRVRAFIPWPTVRAKIENGDEFKILKTRLLPLKVQLKPGELKSNGSDLLMGTAVRTRDLEQTLILETIQLAGKPPTKASDFFRNLLTQSPSKTGQTPVRIVKIEQ